MKIKMTSNENLSRFDFDFFKCLFNDDKRKKFRLFFDLIEFHQIKFRLSDITLGNEKMSLQNEDFYGCTHNVKTSSISIFFSMDNKQNTNKERNLPFLGC